MLGWVGLGWVGLGWTVFGWDVLSWTGLGWVLLGWVGLGWVLLVIGVYRHYQILFGYIVTTRFNGRENTDSYTFSVLN